MYVVKTEMSVPPWVQESFIAAMRVRQDYLEKQPGYQTRRTLRSRGYPSKFTLFTSYDSQAAADAILTSAAFRDVVKSTPLDGATPIGLAEAFEEAVNVQREFSPADVTEVLVAELSMAPGIRDAEFTKVREDLFRVLQKNEPGMVRSRLLRFLGGGGRYVAVHVFTQQRGVAEVQAIPEVAAFYQAYPNSKYLRAEPVGQTFTPVRELAPIAR